MMVGDIYCDMDGVLVDFYDGVVKATGKHITAVKGDEKIAIMKRIFDSGPQFWVNLAPMPDFLQLWNFIKPYHPYILTAMPHKHGKQREVLSSNTEKYAHDGKWEWCQKYLHIPYDKFILVNREHKSNYATSIKNGHVVPNVLIDDTLQNIQDWRANRGVGILHKSALNTIDELSKLGINLGGERKYG